MQTIVLATANARYIHTSFGLRYLKANLHELAPITEIIEFSINEQPVDIAEAILARNPAIVGLGIYIWNQDILERVARILRQLRPDLPIVLGGPEVICAEDLPPIAEHASYIVSGEAEVAFYLLCIDLLAGTAPDQKFIDAALPDLATIAQPYSLYSDEDIAHRVIYIEASRGCPHGCEFCLSGRAGKVRRFSEAVVLAALADLWERGVRRFKFVDRALHLGITAAILDFFIARMADKPFVHFEAILGCLPTLLFEKIRQFPVGSLQLEVGVQTLDPTIAARIGRGKTSSEILVDLRQLKTETAAHLHADLVVGLPGETLSSFAAGFDALLAAAPDEIQVGILKRLRGAAISRHDQEWHMHYSASPPYEILQTKDIDFQLMQRLKRFSRYFDMVVNSGRFKAATPLIWKDQSPFYAFLNFSDWLYAQVNRTFAIAPTKLADFLVRYLVEEKGLDEAIAITAVNPAHKQTRSSAKKTATPQRQQRHNA